MIIKAPDGTLYNANRIKSMWVEKYLYTGANIRFDDIIAGVYDTADMAQKVLEEIYIAWADGKSTYTMPKE